MTVYVIMVVYGALTILGVSDTPLNFCDNNYYTASLWARDYYTIDIIDYVNGIGNCSREQ